MDNCIIDEAVKYIESIFANNTDGHGADHSLRVYNNAVRLAEKYPDCDITVVSLAALLHDADDHKLFNTVNNANARRFLSEHDVGQDVTEKICDVINSVSFSKNKDKSPDTIEEKIVQDSDRLDAIGAVGIARTFAFGGKHGRTIRSSLQHFNEKLLLLKDKMNTEEAKNIAAERHQFMKIFIDEIKKEIDI